MAYSGSGVTPLSPLIEQIRAIAAEKMITSDAYSAALRLAPIRGVSGRSGQFVKDNTRRGFSLAQTPKAGTSVSLYSDQFPQITDAYTLGTYEIELYKLAEHVVPDRVRAEWRNMTDTDQATRVGTMLGTLNAAFHSYAAFSYANTSGNWDSSHAADGGNITSASFDMIGLLNTVRTTLVKAQTWVPGMKLRAFVADDVYTYIQKLDQLRSSLGVMQPANGGAAYLTPGQVEAAMASFLPGLTVERVSTYYEAANGTITADLTGSIIFLPEAPIESAPLVTWAAEDDGGNPAPFAIRSEYDKRIPGERFFCEFDGDIAFVDNKGGYLAHSLLS